jgi:hypothetical protein
MKPHLIFRRYYWFCIGPPHLKIMGYGSSPLYAYVHYLVQSA